MFELTLENKILILILLAAVVLFLLSNKKEEPIHNEGILTQDPKLSNNFNDVIDVGSNDDSFDLTSNSTNNSSISNDSSTSNASNEKLSTNELVKKMSANSTSNDYKASSYSQGVRGKTDSNSLDKFFEGNRPKDSNNNNEFEPMTTDNGQYAAYTSGKTSKKLTDKEKFDPNSLLPRENNSEWFDDPYEQTTVKSSHLINIYRPTAIDTIQTSRKFASHDIRGIPATPKYPVSPWNNSSADADNNIRNESLCV